jgi:hypothetical protein
MVLCCSFWFISHSTQRYNLTTPDRMARVSSHLRSMWSKYGAQTPEWNNDIGTFPGSLEVAAHMSAGNTNR